MMRYNEMWHHFPSNRKWGQSHWSLLLTEEHQSPVLDPAPAFQNHSILIYINSTKSIWFRCRLNYTLQCHVMHPRLRIQTVSSVMVMTCQETHHTAVGTQQFQDLVIIPGQAHGVSGTKVNWKVTWGDRELIKNFHSLICNIIIVSIN